MSEAAPRPGPAHDPRRGRQHALANALRVALGVVLVLAVASVVVGGERGHDTGVAMVAVLAAGPVVRLLWLEARWLRVRDWQYATVVAALLGLVGAATIIGLT